MASSLTFAFLLGALATVNPCGLALLPAYFTNRLHAAPSSREVLSSTAHALTVGGATTLGMASVFVIVGALVSLGLNWISSLLPWAGMAIGVILIALGLAVAVGWKARLGHGPWNALIPSAGSGLRGDISFGIGYGITSLSCSLPIFLSAIGLNLNGSFLANIGNFAAYVLGMGTMFAGLSVGAGLTRNVLALWLKRSLRHMRYINAAFLIFAGGYVTLLWADTFFEGAPLGLSLLGAGEVLSGDLRGWITAAAGLRFIFGVLIFLVALTAWTFYNRVRADESNH